MHTDLRTRSEKDGDGNYSLVSEPLQAIGYAYSYVSNRTGYDRPYSRSYENSGGTVGGVETQDNLTSTKIDAVVYYNSSDWRTYYVGEAVYRSNLTTSYEGEGSYEPNDTQIGVKGSPGESYSYDLKHKESAFSERGDSSNVQKTISTFNTLQNSSAPISVAYDRTIVTHDAYQYSSSSFHESAHGYGSSSSWSTNGDTNENVKSSEETSFSEHSWDYFKRGDSVEGSSRWIGSGSGSRQSLTTNVSYSNSSSSSLYEYQEQIDNSDSYEFEFDGSWFRDCAGVFTIVPIVLSNHVVGVFSTRPQTTSGGQTRPGRLDETTFDRVVSTCGFDTQVGNYVLSDIYLRFTSIRTIDVEYFGHFESAPNYVFSTPEHTIVATSANFAAPGSFATFVIYGE